MGNGICDANGIDAMTQTVIGGMDAAEDRAVLIEREILHGFHTYAGDSNLDGVFDKQDIVSVLEAGKYLTGEKAGWAKGDWEGDLSFDGRDFVRAFVAGGYLQGPCAAAVPEPCSLLTLLVGLMLLIVRRRCHFQRTGAKPRMRKRQRRTISETG